MTTLNGSLVGFPPLQSLALKGTFGSLSANQTFTGTNTLSGATTISGATTLSGATIAISSAATTVSGKITFGSKIAPASVSITPAAGSANVSNVTIQVKDSAGNSLSASTVLFMYLSDSATGDGITATTASGTVTCTTGTDIFDHTAKKIKTIKTNSSGSAVLAVTDTSKTQFYVVVVNPLSGQADITRILTANYG